jgi:hypothetical protein
MINAGIDKIKLILNTKFLNPEYKGYIRADNKLTLHKEGNYTLLSIHAEYFNPFFDFYTQIAYAIYELIEKGVFNFQIINPALTLMYILQHMYVFISGVSHVEFYHDFPKDKVAIDKDAIENGDIVQYKDKDGNPTDTYYSNDYEAGKRKSSFCVYNKREKLLQDNNIKHDTIDDMNVETRIEARLGRENCPYLDIANFTGTFEDIFKRFQPFLGVLCYNYLFGHVDVKGKRNTHYTRLVRSAQKGKTKYYDRKGLKKFEPITELPNDKIELDGERDGLVENCDMTKEIANNQVETYVDDTENYGFKKML